MTRLNDFILLWKIYCLMLSGRFAVRFNILLKIFIKSYYANSLIQKICCVRVYLVYGDVYEKNAVYIYGCSCYCNFCYTFVWRA